MPLPLIICMACICLLDLLIACLPALLRRRGTYLYWRTLFGPALVLDSADNDGVTIRLLNVRNKFQSVCYVDPAIRWELACIYHKYFAEIVDIAGLTSTVDPLDVSLRDAVVIGGGGFSFPKWLVAHCPQLHTTVVEIDPKIIDIARTHFFVDELVKEFNCAADGRLEIVCDDGWRWLKGCHRQFALIVNDAFSGKRPLGTLGTTEGARLIHEHLTADGIYLANIIAPLEGKGAVMLSETVSAFRAEFAHVWLIPEAEELPTVVGDNVLIASDRALDIAHRYEK